MRKIISLLFLLSGIAGLIHEVVWAKHLALSLGNTTQAHTIVLATLMGGRALSYYLFGKITDKGGSALSLYGLDGDGDWPLWPLVRAAFRMVRIRTSANSLSLMT